jgi:hypothetical protein
MIEERYLNVLQMICERLGTSPINWVVTGSLGMALQGMDVPIHDIDLQTDEKGAYKIERHLSEYALQPVRYAESELIRSHYGALEIDGIKVEIMGALQKCLDNQTWEEPVRVEEYKRWVEIDGMQIPVLSLAYEYQAYLKLGRDEKAEAIKRWLQGTEIDD